MDLPDLSKGGDMTNRQSSSSINVEVLLRPLLLLSIFKAAMKTLSQIISEGLGLGDKPDYVSVKAMTTVIKKDTAVYMVSTTGC